MYRVLTPIFEKTGEVTYKTVGNGTYQTQWERVTWIERGLAADMEDAKAKFGGSPVLDWIRQIH